MSAFGQNRLSNLLSGTKSLFPSSLHVYSSPTLQGFDELLSPAEKSKLYTAIGYSETAANPNLPKDVSHKSRSFQSLQLDGAILDKKN